MTAMRKLSDHFERPSIASWRSLKFFTFARGLTIGLILLVEVFLLEKIAQGAARQQTVALLVVYFSFACAFAWLALMVRTSFYAQVLAQFFIDLLFIGLLLFQAGGVRSGLGILLFMPLSGAALLLPFAAAMFCAAITAIVLLLDAAYTAWSGSGEVQWVASALHGAGAFAIAGVFQGLTARAAREERKARLAAEAADHQALLSQRVMGELEPGVLVLDADLRVRSVNPAARALFADTGVLASPGEALPSDQHLAGLRSLIESAARVQPGSEYPQGVPDEITIGAGGERFAVRVSMVSRGAEEPPDRVVFIESMRAQEERMQRSKLASMGRLTGSIAHEIRNPLAAISHAGALLADDLSDPVQARMLAIIRENTVRINLIIEDVLALSRSDRAQIQALELPAAVREAIAELPADPVINLVGSARGMFDPLHLRLTLINLLRNAQRHTQSQVLVRIEQPSNSDVEIQVIDDGATLSLVTREHLFEPFFTTQTQGTGLGLYLAREYCLANHAQLTYEERIPSLNSSTPTINPSQNEKMFVIRLQAAR